MEEHHLIQSHAEEKHHHVYDLVHDHFPLEADEEEHSSADVDPVFDQQSHHQLPQHLHQVILIALLFLILFIYKPDGKMTWLWKIV